MKSEEILKKILICLYVVIALLVVNTGILLVKEVTFATDKKEETSNYDVSMFTAINGSEFFEIAKSSDTKVIYLGRSTCGYCVQFLPTLQQAQEELKYKTYYVDITTINEKSEDDKAMIEKINDFTASYNEKSGQTYESIYGYTPMVVLVKDDKIVDVWIGYGNYETYIDWLDTNGIK